MARNFIQDGRYLHLIVGAGVTSGTPVAVGQITGVTTIDADAVTNRATVDTKGVYDLSVQAVNGGGNNAVVVGDAIYYNAGVVPPLNKNNAGILFGHALEGILAGATDTINVKLVG